MDTRPGTSPDNAELRDSRPEADGVVTDSRDQVDNGSGSLVNRDRGPLPIHEFYQPGELQFMILWKVNHVVETGCESCQAELGELLQDWRSQSEPHSP